MKRTIIAFTLIALGLMTVSQAVFADSAVLSVTPAAATSTVNVPFNVSVNIDPAGNKVCVVKGTVNLNNLSCQSITLGNGVMAQTAPTCAAPNFIIGIPKCTTISENLFSVSVKGLQVGQASSTLTGVKVIGAGDDVVFTTQSGDYNIVPASVVPQAVHPVIVSSQSGNQGTTQVQSNKPAGSTTGSSTDLTSTSTATTTAKESFFSGLTASVAEAFSSAAKFVGENIVWILFLLIIILTISQITLWRKLNGETKQK